MKIPKFFSKNKKISKTYLVKSIEIDPFVYWKNILILMLFVLIIVGLVSIGVYYGLDHGYFINSKSKDAVENLENTELKTNDLNFLVSEFDNRVLEREKIINSVSVISDPGVK
jgi:Na+/H+ antiporter NhaC